ncbi:hypothetical protein [Spirosoma rigui]|uniref:hypothetical protein n=1 Tax=Spirosoma rigui TaxID=564064 RepID=UPI0009AFA30D|nr:hypothetical protein [Spirosoma rigui]
MMLTAQAALFKSEGVKMLANSQTAAYISKALDVSVNLIYRWKNHNPGVKKVSSEQNGLVLENQQCKDRVRQLETEREVLKMPGRRSCLAFSADRPEVTL